VLVRVRVLHNLVVVLVDDQVVAFHIKLVEWVTLTLKAQKGLCLLL
jgi:hypothetical protein